MDSAPESRQSTHRSRRRLIRTGIDENNACRSVNSSSP
ncbi:Uncharacterised protein [Mycobacteroides abscessus subsp. abscessus]|nr:Uncharacterised protein [Mycobacteroides abscessus subsp. abscessus]